MTEILHLHDHARLRRLQPIAYKRFLRRLATVGLPVDDAGVVAWLCAPDPAGALAGGGNGPGRSAEGRDTTLAATRSRAVPMAST